MNDAMTVLRAIASFGAVLAVLAVFVWALRRGSLRLSRFAPRGAVAVETAISLGERRSLAIITVEGRRMKCEQVTAMPSNTVVAVSTMLRR